MPKVRVRLRVEELDGRVLPSASFLTFPFTIPSFAPVAQVHHHAGHHADSQRLGGSGQGTYVREVGIPDTGTTYDFTGVATLNNLGNITVTGSAHSVGFILQGRATASLTFTNANGSLTVQLTGPLQNGFAPLPQEFSYQVVSGTGAYQHFHADGTLQLILTPGSDVSAGTFALKM